MELVVHHTKDPFADTKVPDPHQDTFSKTVLGFWMYLMTDCLLFATLFVTYAVLQSQTAGGPSSKEVFSLSNAFIETQILLLSSVTCGFALLASLKDKKGKVMSWLLVTAFLGLFFVGIELAEFTKLLQEGHSFKKSAFLSSFFTLVGTHGLHVSFGLIWMVVMIFQIGWQGINGDTFRRLVLLSLFWHFLDLVWIFIFTFVYLLGVL